MDGCVFCDRAGLRAAADVYFENELFVYASTRDPRDPPEVLPGSGIAVPVAHHPSPFDFAAEEWVGLGEVLRLAKAEWDRRLAPDGYFLSWTVFPERPEHVPLMHAHLHVVPRFDDEPHRERGGRVGIKDAGNIRPDPSAPGSGRARLFGTGA